jgi:hypothetical protein
MPMITGMQAGFDWPFNAESVVDAEHDCWVQFTVELSVTAQLLSAQAVQVDLLVRPPGGDVVPFASAKLSSTQGSGVSLLSIATTISRDLSAFVPAQWLITLALSGAGTAVLTQAQKAIFA